MVAFVAGRADILLATTIIESGLDIPNANTIFIDEADTYGLADLHQLRAQPGWRQPSARHWSRDLAGPAEQQLDAGLEAMKRKNWPQALEHFRQASAADPTDPYALVFLGQALERTQRPALAQQAYERAVALDPLCSRPPRALAALHPRSAVRWADAAASLNPLVPGAETLPPRP
jgi:tetratricopeptide (TPR) repeat protein